MITLLYYAFFYVFFCLLQFFFGKYLNIGGIFPNFILIAVVYLGLTRGKLSAEVMGFLFGLTWDAFSTDVFGVRAVMFTLIGYFAGILSKKFDKNQVFTQMVAVFLSSVIYWIGFSLIYYVLPEGAGSYMPFVVSLYGSLKIGLTVIAAPVIFIALDFFTRSGRKYL